MKFLLFIIIGVTFFSCGNKDKVPPGILSQDEMKEVMWDMLRADEMVLNISAKDSLLDVKAKSAELYNQVFSIHHISKEKFQKSLLFYQSRPDLFKQVMDSLQSLERRVNEESYGQRPLRDTTAVKRPKPLQK